MKRSLAGILVVAALGCQPSNRAQQSAADSTQAPSTPVPAVDTVRHDTTSPPDTATRKP